MLLQVFDLFYQQVTTPKNTQSLFSVKNLELIDKLADK